MSYLSKGLNRNNTIFFIVFILMQIIVWSPLKKFSYFLPLLLILLLFVLSGDFKVLLKCFVFSMGIVVYGAFVLLLNQSGNFANVLVFVVTFSSFAFIYAISKKYCDQQEFYFKTANLLLWVIFFEAVIGIIQGGYGAIFAGTFDGGVGDRVEGTIDLALKSSRSFSNPLFATNMVFTLLYVWPSVAKDKKKWLIMLLGGISVVLASVMHLILFLALAFLFAGILLNKGWIFNRTIFAALSLILLVFLSLSLIAPANVGNFLHKYELAQESRSPKARVLTVVANELPRVSSFAPIFGTGPGQFVSRASHLSSGYLSGDILEDFGAGRSEYFKRFMDPILIWVGKIYHNPGSTENPFFSWGMVCSEFGLFGIFLIIILIKKGISIRQYYDSSNSTVNSCVFMSIVMVLFFFLIGFQDSYWETPQVAIQGLTLLYILRTFILAKVDFQDSIGKVE